MELPQVGATLRSYVSKSGALQAMAAVPAGLVTCDATGAVTLQEEEDGPEVIVDVSGATAVPLDLEVKRLPPFQADASSGEVSGPLGGLEHVAEGVLALSRALGSPSVAFAWLPTTDDTPLILSAREGEGVVVVIGEETYEMDEGWPPRRPAP